MDKIKVFEKTFKLKLTEEQRNKIISRNEFELHDISLESWYLIVSSAYNNSNDKTEHITSIQDKKSLDSCSGIFLFKLNEDCYLYFFPPFLIIPCCD